MKFVYFGYDFAINTLLRLINDGHELLGIFTFPCDNIFTFNNQLQALAKDKNVPLTTEKANQATINHWIDRGCELFLVAGYPYKVPHIDENRAYGVNIHPSLLPQGRGIMPLPTVIMHAPEAAGFTAHKLTSTIDGGDILAQQKIDIGPQETIETLSSRIALAMPDLASSLIANLPTVWESAQQQDESQATIFPVPNDAMRTINWNNTTEDIITLHRAFGRFGLLFNLDGELWAGYSMDSWQQTHPHPPGTIQLITAREIIIAAKDGFICIKEAEKMKSN